MARLFSDHSSTHHLNVFSEEDEDKVTIKVGKVEKQLTLTLSQKAILNSQDPFVTIQGAPGTGKTTVLMRKGLQWLQAGREVVVLSLRSNSLPSSRLIYLYLCEERKAYQGPMTPEDKTWGNVNFEFLPVRNTESLGIALDILKKHGNSDLHVIMDNQTADNIVAVMLHQQFIKMMKEGISGFHLWTADWLPNNIQNATVHVLSRPLRYPAPVMHEISVSVQVSMLMGLIPESHTYDIHPNMVCYPDVIHTRHRKGKWPINSEKCGHKVAKILRKIGVGEAAATAHSEAEGGTNIGGHNPQYQYRDVLVLCRNFVDPRTPPGFVVGLEACGIPTKIFGSGNYANTFDAIDDVILANEDKVLVAHYTAVVGLERKVVVCLIGAEEPEENFQEENKGEMDYKHRVSIYTRCSEQLIVIHMPKGVEGGPNGQDDFGRKCSIL